MLQLEQEFIPHAVGRQDAAARDASWLSKVLLTTTLAMVVQTPAIPFMPFAHFLGFVALPATLIAALVAIMIAYVMAAELTKRRFYSGSARMVALTV